MKESKNFLKRKQNTKPDEQHRETAEILEQKKKVGWLWCGCLGG